MYERRSAAGSSSAAPQDRTDLRPRRPLRAPTGLSPRRLFTTDLKSAASIQQVSASQFAVQPRASDAPVPLDRRRLDSVQGLRRFFNTLMPPVTALHDATQSWIDLLEPMERGVERHEYLDRLSLSGADDVVQ